MTLTEKGDRRPAPAARRGSRTALPTGDKIVRLDNQPVDSYAEFVPTSRPPGNAAAGDSPADVPPEKGSPPAEARTKSTVRVAPDPMRWFGLMMEMGPITAIQAGSPAAAAGIEPGGLDPHARRQAGRRSHDPARTVPRPPGRKGHAGHRARSRKGRKRPADSPHVRPRDDFDSPWSRTTRWRYPRWASPIRCSIASARWPRAPPPPRPASTAATKSPGDHSAARRRNAEAFAREVHSRTSNRKKWSLSFDDEGSQLAVPPLRHAEGLPGTTVELQWLREKDRRHAGAEAAPGWFNPDRGFVFGPKFFVHRRASARPSPWAKKTLDKTLLVYRTLLRMVPGRCRPT